MLQIVMRLYCKEFKSCPTDLVKFPSSAFKKKKHIYDVIRYIHIGIFTCYAIILKLYLRNFILIIQTILLSIVLLIMKYLKLFPFFNMTFKSGFFERLTYRQQIMMGVSFLKCTQIFLAPK